MSNLNVTQKAPKEQENVTDAIIKAFIVKRRKAMIDQEDNQEDNVDYETSEQRLMILAILFAFILTIFATILTSVLVNQQSKTPIIIHPSPMKKESQFPLVPHLALLFNDGSMKIYEFSSDNAKLNIIWTFKVPQQKVPKCKNCIEGFGDNPPLIPGYILSILHGDMFIFDMGGKTDTTVLTKSGTLSNNLTHYRIKQSKVPTTMLYDSRFSLAGNQIWIMGGSEQAISTDSVAFQIGFPCDKSVMDKVSRKTLIWNLERQIYYPGPELPSKAMGKGCQVTLNRTHVLILYNDQNKHNCLDAWMYSFEEFQWTHLNECFYEPPNSTQLRFDLMCASYLDKYMNRKILVGLKAVNILLCYGEYFNLLLLDLKTKTTSFINFNVIDMNGALGVSRAISVFENQGRFFILTAPIIGLTDVLSLYTLNDNVLVLSQNISVSFRATSDSEDVPVGLDFKVATGQFRKSLW